MAYPATAQSVQVRTTDTTVGDLDIDVGLFPLLGLEFLPDHVALSGAGVETHPAYEFVVGLSHDVCVYRGVCKMYTFDVRGGKSLVLIGAAPFISLSGGSRNSQRVLTQSSTRFGYSGWRLKNSARYGEELVSSAGFPCRSGSFAMISEA